MPTTTTATVLTQNTNTPLEQQSNLQTDERATKLLQGFVQLITTNNNNATERTKILRQANLFFGQTTNTYADAYLTKEAQATLRTIARPDLYAKSSEDLIIEEALVTAKKLQALVSFWREEAKHRKTDKCAAMISCLQGLQARLFLTLRQTAGSEDTVLNSEDTVLNSDEITKFITESTHSMNFMQAVLNDKDSTNNTCALIWPQSPPPETLKRAIEETFKTVNLLGDDPASILIGEWSVKLLASESLTAPEVILAKNPLTLTIRATSFADPAKIQEITSALQRQIFYAVILPNLFGGKIQKFLLNDNDNNESLPAEIQPILFQYESLNNDTNGEADLLEDDKSETGLGDESENPFIPFGASPANLMAIGGNFMRDFGKEIASAGRTLVSSKQTTPSIGITQSKATPDVPTPDITLAPTPDATTPGVTTSDLLHSHSSKSGKGVAW
jgi:hypothetical protein